jgi:hypothetical protein
MTFRSALLAFVACAGLPMALAAAQLPGPVPREKDPPSQQARAYERQLSLTVFGCVRGRRLLLGSRSFDDGTAKLLNANELTLEGSRDLMQLLRREHDNHDDELIGVAILPASPDGSSTTSVESKPVGEGGRITLGVRESNGVAGTVRMPVRFKVTGVRHVHEQCARADRIR